ncbi:hypothetical protein GBAR_LOCUS29035 [Geodia barretti]|uniref:Uncharacterized protein n=1 Tax=Geodia barretti TaxID=519541 RepID=A0AA35TSR2_GEOBA|nr:hypothetical protein GBAR_LOCUS29035 [Geodia barretti]
MWVATVLIVASVAPSAATCVEGSREIFRECLEIVR